MATISWTERTEFVHRALVKFDTFWRQKLPVPVDPIEDIYKAAYTDKGWAAIEYLIQERLDILRPGNTFELFLQHRPRGEESGGTSNAPSIEFPLSPEAGLPTVDVFLSDLSGDIQSRLIEWVEQVKHYIALRGELLARCRGIVGNPYNFAIAQPLDPCINTVSQLYKIWPESYPVFPVEWKKEFMQASGRTKLPPRIGYSVRRGNRLQFATPAAFRCEDAFATEEETKRWTEINDILTIISLTDGMTIDHQYPSFFRFFTDTTLSQAD